MINMTQEFLEFLIQKYPNDYELGEMIRAFYFLYNENQKFDVIELEQIFINKYIGKGISFQNAQ